MEASFDKNQDLGVKVETCAKHGEFESRGMKYAMMRREIWTTCQQCQSEREEADRRFEAEAKAAKLRDMLDTMMLNSRLPERLRDCTFANYIAQTDPMKDALQTAMDYAENFAEVRKVGESLIFAGKPGTGKGHLAASIMNKLMPDYLPVYTTCLDMIRSVRETWRKDSRHSELEVLNEYEGAALLVIDEIGVQYGTDGEQTIIFDVLDRRYRRMRPTILITNQDRAGFAGFIGERTFDRLRQTAKWVSFDWASYRPTARKAQA